MTFIELCWYAQKLQETNYNNNNYNGCKTDTAMFNFCVCTVYYYLCI